MPDAPDAPDAIDETLALAQRLPAGAIAGVFARYGKPFDLPDDGDPARVAIALTDERTAILRLARIRTPVDVIANDWFVLDAPDADSLAMPGPLFAAAVAALTRVRERSSPT